MFYRVRPIYIARLSATDQQVAALAAARSGCKLAGELGRPGRCEDAHQNRRDEEMLDVCSVGEGALGVVVDCSSEKSLATVLLVGDEGDALGHAKTR